MRLTFLILSAAVLFESFPAFAEDNYSLWPRRPAELEQARRLVREQKLTEAADLLKPFVTEKGIAGREARQITGAVNVRRYLTRMHPRAAVYKVKRGENMAKLSHATRCPSDVIMLLNGIVEPSALKAGQKLVVVPMDLRLEIHPLQREVSVWDGSCLVASYSLAKVEGAGGSGNEETSLLEREGYLQGSAVQKHSMQFLVSDRALHLGNGMYVAGGQRVKGSVVFRMEQRDLNELALLLGVGARVSIVRDEDSFIAGDVPQDH